MPIKLRLAPAVSLALLLVCSGAAADGYRCAKMRHELRRHSDGTIFLIIAAQPTPVTRPIASWDDFVRSGVWTHTVTPIADEELDKFTKGPSRAKEAASELAFGKQVTIREIDTDRYGRTVADVILPDGRSLGREMVAEGYAWWFAKYAPHDRELARLQAEARAAGRGLWSQPNPVPPWDWRRGVGVPVTAEVIGNRRSHLYHAPHCRGAMATSERNRVVFKTAEEAEEKGYHRAVDCP